MTQEELVRAWRYRGLVPTPEALLRIAGGMDNDTTAAFGAFVADRLQPEQLPLAQPGTHVTTRGQPQRIEQRAHTQLETDARRPGPLELEAQPPQTYPEPLEVLEESVAIAKPPKRKLKIEREVTPPDESPEDRRRRQSRKAKARFNA